MSSAEGIVLMKTVSRVWDSSVKFSRQCCLENIYNNGLVTYFESENCILVLSNILIFFNSPLP